MRSFLLASTVLGLAAAAPAPQDIDFSLAYALPNPTFTEATGVTEQIVTYNPTTVFSAAIEQVTATQTATDDGTEVATTDAPKKRAVSCATQPTGYGPVPSPDSPSAFLSYSAFSSAASAAPIPSGYSQEFVNLEASNNAYGYLGYTTLKSYDVDGCAAQCNAINGCISINIYYERDPTVNPGSSCPNPASTTTIKCVFWGGPVSASNALNAGQYRDEFEVVIAGSNGYMNNTVVSPPGYGAPIYLGAAAINAPYDTYGYNSFMGDAIFIGTFDADLCAQACTTKSNYALAHPPTDGTPVQTCQFFNTYILYINTTAHIQGQYCAMYSESWPSSYATNIGQYSGSDHFLIEYSFAYSNATNPGAPNPTAAAYQAKTDILWPANSATAFCSSLLGYTTPVATVSSVVSSTPLATATTTVEVVETSYVDVVASTTVTELVKRQATATTVSVSTGASGQLVRVAVATATATLAERDVIATPAVLTKYPASIVTWGCSLAVATPSVTSTVVVTLTDVVFTLTDATATVSSYSTTVVTTTATTAVATATPSGEPCGQTLAALDGVGWPIVCNGDINDSQGHSSYYQTVSATSVQDCVDQTEDTDYGFAFVYDFATGSCVMHTVFADDPVVVINSAPGLIVGYTNPVSVSYE